jgi:hypothetical protein
MQNLDLLAYVTHSLMDYVNVGHGCVGKTRVWTQNYRSTALLIE